MPDAFTLQTAAVSGPLGTVIILLAAGLLALGVELFVVPGFGIAGVLGIGTLLAGSLTAWMEFGAFWGGIVITGTVVVSVLMTVFISRSKAVRKRFVLDTRLEAGRGTQSQELASLLEKTGIAVTTLRPAGIARIEDRRVDVVSEGGYIDKDTEIRVVAIDGPRVIVARVK